MNILLLKLLFFIPSLVFGLNVDGLKRLSIIDVVNKGKLVKAENGKEYHLYKIDDYSLEQFHWLAQDRIESLVPTNINYNFEKDGFPLKKHSLTNSILGQNFPQLNGKPGLFVFSHPVTGMGSGESTDGRFYGDIPIKLCLKKGLKAVAVVTQSGASFELSNIDFEGVDLIFHVTKTRMFDNTWALGMMEYVILNPKSVKDFTSDPDFLHDELVNAFKKLKSLNSTELHEKNKLIFHTSIWRYFQDDPISEPIYKKAESIIKKYLSQKKTIPSFFLRKPIVQCEQLF